jgi:thiol:disulfide interchange protein
MKHLRKLFVITLICITANISLFAQILEPVKWSFSSKRINDTIAELTLKATIDKGWHVYSQFIPDGGPIPTTFTFTKNNDYQLIGKVREPKPLEEIDPNFDNMVLKFFANSVQFKQKVKILSNKPITIKGVLNFMCCDDKQCLPPSDVDFEFKLDGAKTVTKTPPIVNDVKDTLKTSVKDSSMNHVNNDTASTNKKTIPTNISEDKNNSLWGFFWIAFLSGLIAILTPCVFPMIPMTVSFFLHSSKSKAKARLQALIYGISIIIIYTLVGTLLAVFLGPDFANWLSTHWLPNIFFFLIFLLFAASFFGMFEMTLPSWMVNKSDKQADKGGFFGAFFMAFTLVLVSFSCTGPIVGMILVLSAGGAILKPIIGMFGFGLAFALPFTVFAFFPSMLKNLPKSGGWLNVVKVVLGFLELALGLKFLSVADQTYHWHILDREVYLAIWIVIFTLLGFYLLGKLKFAHDDEVKHVSVPRLILAIITFSFVIYMIPGMFGAPLKALTGYMPPQHTLDFDLNKIIRENVEAFGGGGGTNKNTSLCEAPKYADKLELPHGLKGYFDYDEALKCAKEQNKPLFIDFTGHGCVNCREMEARVWSNTEVLKRLKNNFIVVSLYVDDKVIELPPTEQYISKYSGKLITKLGPKNADIQMSKYNRNSQPFYILLDNNGELLNQPRAYNLDVDAYIKFLDEGYSEFQKRAKK